MKNFFKYNVGAAAGALVLIMMISVFAGINRTASTYKNKVLSEYGGKNSTVVSDISKYADHASHLSAAAKANGCDTSLLDGALADLDMSDPFGGLSVRMNDILSQSNIVYAELSAKKDVDADQMRSATSYYYEMKSAEARLRNSDGYNDAAEKYNKLRNTFPANIISLGTKGGDAAVFWKK